jgi:hypothetical protein
MNEAIIRRELYQMLRYRYDLWPDHFPDVAAAKQPGRPDLVVMNPKGPGYYVEVKALNLDQNKSFAFSDITDGQRLWLDTWEEARAQGSWLAIGVYQQRHEIYLIPWIAWTRVEAQVRPHQDSLPYTVGPGYLKELQSQGLDFRLLEQYKLVRVKTADRLPGESGWKISHSWEALWRS